jgi:hypothetical protein
MLLQATLTPTVFKLRLCRHGIQLHEGIGKWLNVTEIQELTVAEEGTAIGAAMIKATITTTGMVSSDDGHGNGSSDNGHGNGSSDNGHGNGHSSDGRGDESGDGRGDESGNGRGDESGDGSGDGSDDLGVAE